MDRPADPIAYLHLVRAHYYAEAAEWPQAVAELRRAIDRDPKSAPLWHLLARWLERQGAHAEAITAAKEAIALDPGAAGAYLTLAEAYHAQKNETEADRRPRAGDPAEPEGRRSHTRSWRGMPRSGRTTLRPRPRSSAS